MKLSLAIRLGAMIRPQGFLFKEGGISGKRTCALNAACEAMGMPQTPDSFWILWPWTRTLMVACPECGQRGHHVSGVISLCLNDGHHWTRERIADFVATIEPQEAAVGEEAHEAVNVCT